MSPEPPSTWWWVANGWRINFAWTIPLRAPILPVKKGKTHTHTHTAVQQVDHIIQTFCKPGTSIAISLEENKQWDNFSSSAVVINAGAPQGCILTSLLYSHFTHGCVAICDRDHIIKCAGGKTDREKPEYWWVPLRTEVVSVARRSAGVKVKLI